MVERVPKATGAGKSKYWRKPLDAQRVKVPHGRINILIDRCKGCRFCVTYCPRNVLDMSEGFNVKGHHYPVAKNIDDCVNCGLCERLCPEFAIFSVEVVEEEGASDDCGS